jgi:hypothetical protein
VDTRPPEMSQRLNRGVFVKLPPPLVPINRELPLQKISLLTGFLLKFGLDFLKKASRDQVFVASRFPPTFNGIAFFVTQLLFLLFIVLVFFVLRTLFTNTVLLFLTNVVSILLKLLSNRWLELKALQDP